MRTAAAFVLGFLFLFGMYLLWPRTPEFPRAPVHTYTDGGRVAVAANTVLNGYGCREDVVEVDNGVSVRRVRYPSGMNVDVLAEDMCTDVERSGGRCREAGEGAFVIFEPDGGEYARLFLTADESLLPPDRRCAVLIDDFGEAPVSNCRAILALPCTLSVSIIPGRSLSRTLAREATATGREVLVHFPLSPLGYPRNNPGAGTITTDMDSARIALVVANGFESVPGAVGSNHHMGSLASADWGTMIAFAAALKEHNAFYVDSRTTVASVGDSAARYVGIPSTFNEEFIDDSGTRSAVLDSELTEIARTAVKKGAIVVIGHPHPETVRAIERNLCEFERRGVRFVPVSDVIENPAGDVASPRPRWRPESGTSTYHTRD
jgi:polysaccharide deacetylase 2 family uncharacterized protein YibQ